MLNFSQFLHRYLIGGNLRGNTTQKFLYKITNLYKNMIDKTIKYVTIENHQGVKVKTKEFSKICICLLQKMHIVTNRKGGKIWQI